MTLNLLPTKTSLKTLASAPRLRVEGDELFPELVRIECRVCGQEERVALDHPALLCADCLLDLTATARRTAEAYVSAMVAYFDAEKALHERAKGNAWYAKTEKARGDTGVAPEKFARAWGYARGEGGEKAILVGLRDHMDTAAEQMRVAEQRYISAAPELEAARAAFGEPVEVI